MMRNIGNVLAAVVFVGAMSGCSNLQTRPANYNDLPGSGDQMAKGPGVINGGHYDAETNSFLLYSDRKHKQAMLPSFTGRKQPSASSAQPATSTEVSAAPAPQTAAVPGETSSQPPSTAQTSDYQQFEQFQRYQQFEQMPSGSPEKQKFEQWQQWQQFKQWQRSQ